MQSRKRVFSLFVMMVLVLLAFGLACCGCSSAEVPDEDDAHKSPAADNGGKGEEEDGEAVTLTYLGHATFILETADGKVLIDPYDPQFGTYGRIDQRSDVVTVSHGHNDHNYAAGGGAEAVVLQGLTSGGDWNEIDHRLGETRIYNVGGTLHGRNLGKNSIFVFETPSLRLVHLGDLGHLLTDDQIGLIGKADVLMIPVGGYYTISPEDALEVIARISPSVVIPIHYLTVDNADSPIGTLEDFLNMDFPYAINRCSGVFPLSAKLLPEQTEIWPMEYTRP